MLELRENLVKMRPKFRYFAFSFAFHSCRLNVIIILIYCMQQDASRVTSEHRGLEPMVEDIGPSKQAPVSIFYNIR